jgi:flagellar biosynthesis protein FlhB
VVAKAAGPEGELLRLKGIELGIPEIRDPEVAFSLYEKGKLREFIGEEFYPPVIKILNKLGLI